MILADLSVLEIPLLGDVNVHLTFLFPDNVDMSPDSPEMGEYNLSVLKIWFCQCQIVWPCHATVGLKVHLI